MKSNPLVCRPCGGTGMLSDPKALRDLRKNLRFTMTETAKRMGISISYLNELEHGRKPWNHDLETRFRKAIR